jgi:type IV pilus assembly protein PilX
MTLIGVAAMQGTTQQESMASNARQRNLAFQAAEAALRAGEMILQGATLPTFDNTGANLGLRQPVIPTTDVGAFWLDVYCWIVGPGCASAESQSYTGTLAQISTPPRYVIEELPRVTLPGGSVKFGALPDTGFYRVTARSLGGVTDAVVILQSTYRR